MKNIPFYKYQGAGNDFILIDNRQKLYQLSVSEIAKLCDRRFGIGADGLMLLQETAGFDFEMVYFNADGNESTMCGNGGRCITQFAKDLGIIKDKAVFIAIDGAHEAQILENEIIALGMIDVHEISFEEEATILNTGSPHFVRFVEDLKTQDIVKEGRKIRHQERFGAKGINVNFVEKDNETLHIRTYERGVEDETLACGTGVTAAAIASVGIATGNFEIEVKALGGDLKVSFQKTDKEKAQHIVLQGPAQFVFQGNIQI